MTLSLSSHQAKYGPAQSLDRHLASTPSSAEETALSEALKLIFNLMHHAESLAFQFTSILPTMLKLLDGRQPALNATPTASTIHLINVLLNFDLVPSVFFPSKDPSQHVLPLLNILETNVKTTPVQELDVVASPIFTLLRRVLDIAPVSVKSVMQQRLLPTAEDRHKPLGQSETLPSRLLRLSISGFTPILRDCVPHLLFELSDRDAEKFVRNVGYGYASGFLTNNKIPAPRLDKQEHKDGNDDINFVTGQFIKDQPQGQQESMTEEEKMREAERLFVLFERQVSLRAFTYQELIRNN